MLANNFNEDSFINIKRFQNLILKFPKNKSPAIFPLISNPLKLNSLPNLYLNMIKLSANNCKMHTKIEVILSMIAENFCERKRQHYGKIMQRNPIHVISTELFSSTMTAKFCDTEGEKVVPENLHFRFFCLFTFRLKNS